MGKQENLKVSNLSDLPANADLAALLDAQQADKKPFSSRAKIVVEFDDSKGRYVLSKEDEAVLQRYEISISEFLGTLRHIEENVHLKPFEFKQPFLRWFGFRILSVILFFGVFYSAFLLLQMALFNLVLVGVFFYYLHRLAKMLNAFEHRQDLTYRTRPLKTYVL